MSVSLVKFKQIPKYLNFLENVLKFPILENNKILALLNRLNNMSASGKLQGPSFLILFLFRTIRLFRQSKKTPWNLFIKLET